MDSKSSSQIESISDHTDKFLTLLFAATTAYPVAVAIIVGLDSNKQKFHTICLVFVRPTRNPNSCGTTPHRVEWNGMPALHLGIYTRLHYSSSLGTSEESDCEGSFECSALCTKTSTDPRLGQFRLNLELVDLCIVELGRISARLGYLLVCLLDSVGN